MSCVVSRQLLISIPLNKLPCRKTEVEEYPEDDDDDEEDVGRRGQILWIRGLTRLQTQVGVLDQSQRTAYSPPSSCLSISATTVVGKLFRLVSLSTGVSVVVCLSL